MYKWYGARGITVCDEWRDSFLQFLQDMGPRPKLHTLERCDNDGHYSPDNCRWATRQEQAINRAPMGTHLTAEEKAKWKVKLSNRGKELAKRYSGAKFRNPPKICIQCGGEYRRQGHTKFPPKFCSRACYYASRTLSPKSCEQCGVLFKPKQRHNTARFCTTKCWGGSKTKK